MSGEKDIYFEKARNIGTTLEGQLGIANASKAQADLLATTGSFVFAGRFSATKPSRGDVSSEPETNLNGAITEGLRSAYNRLSPRVYAELVRELATLRAYQLKLYPEIMEDSIVRWDYLRARLTFPSTPKRTVTLFPPHRQEFLAAEYACGEEALKRFEKEASDTPHIFLIPGNDYVGQVLAEGRHLFDIPASTVSIGSPGIRDQAEMLATVNPSLGDLAIFHPFEGLSREDIVAVLGSTYSLLRRGGILVVESALNHPSAKHTQEAASQAFHNPSRMSVATGFGRYEIFVK